MRGKLKIEFICSVASKYSYSLLEILYVLFAVKCLVNNFPSLHNIPGSVGKDIESIPPSFNLLIISNNKKLSDFTDNEDIFNYVSDEIEKLNQKFSNPEQIKKFSILPRDFSIDEGELTPTLKIRRKQINDNWSEVINAMYSE